MVCALDLCHEELDRGERSGVFFVPMSDQQPLVQEKTNTLPILDEQLVQWMALQALQDRNERLAKGGVRLSRRRWLLPRKYLFLSLIGAAVV